MRIGALSGWTSEQKHVVAASFLGWTLDAFDFFLVVFVLRDIAKEFRRDPGALNELSPDEARGTFPGVTYQIGNLIASANATLQAAIAAYYGGSYAFALRGRGRRGGDCNRYSHRFRNGSQRRGVRNCRRKSDAFVGLTPKAPRQ